MIFASDNNIPYNIDHANTNQRLITKEAVLKIHMYRRTYRFLRPNTINEITYLTKDLILHRIDI